MWEFRWERHVYNLVEKKHVKETKGCFLAGSLQGAKMKATRESGMLHGEWGIATSAPISPHLRGRVYIKQAVSPRTESENMNPKLYLYVLGNS